MSRSARLGLVLVLSSAACSVTPSHAQFDPPWVHVFSSSALSAAYDTSRITPRADSVQIWTLWQYAQPQVQPDSTGTFDVVEIEFVVQCAARKVRDGKITLLSQGDSVWGWDFENPVRDLVDSGRGRALLVICDRLSKTENVEGIRRRSASEYALGGELAAVQR